MRRRRNSTWEVFLAFAKLGVTSFGGPIAHLGFFRTEFVDRRRWLTDADYADLVALCQIIPGPASSQVGFGIGLLRAGPLGAIAAFLAFTLPSAALMVAFAFGVGLFEGVIGGGLLVGLKVAAVAIVAHAVAGMARTLTPDRTRALIAVVAAGAALGLPGSAGQVAAIAAGALAGLLWCRPPSEQGRSTLRYPVTKRAGLLFGGTAILLLLGLPIAAATVGGAFTPADVFYRAGALVFGGGHVVLPLLQAGLVETGSVPAETFLAGYAAAQAVPGPLFTFAAFLGAVAEPGGLGGAAIALVAIFLPGFLILLAALPFWNALRERRWSRSLLQGANAAVVGILAAALYDPVFTTAITGPATFCLALLCFVLLSAARFPAWLVVLIAGGGGIVLTAGW